MRSPKHSLQLTLKTAAISARPESATCAAPSSCPYVCATSCCSTNQWVLPDQPFIISLDHTCAIYHCVNFEQSVFGGSYSFLPPLLLLFSPRMAPLFSSVKYHVSCCPTLILPHYLLLSSIGLFARIFRFYPNSFILFNLKKFQSELHNTFLHSQGRPHFRSPSPCKFLIMFSTIQTIATQFQILIKSQVKALTFSLYS